MVVGGGPRVGKLSSDKEPKCGVSVGVEVLSIGFYRRPILQASYVMDLLLQLDLHHHGGNLALVLQ